MNLSQSLETCCQLRGGELRAFTQHVHLRAPKNTTAVITMKLRSSARAGGDQKWIIAINTDSLNMVRLSLPAVFQHPQPYKVPQGHLDHPFSRIGNKCLQNNFLHQTQNFYSKPDLKFSCRSISTFVRCPASKQTNWTNHISSSVEVKRHRRDCFLSSGHRRYDVFLFTSWALTSKLTLMCEIGGVSLTFLPVTAFMDFKLIMYTDKNKTLFSPSPRPEATQAENSVLVFFYCAKYSYIKHAFGCNYT